MTDLSRFFDDDVPDDVLNDPTWEPKLLPDITKLPTDSTFKDIIETEYDGDSYGPDNYEDEEW